MLIFAALFFVLGIFVLRARRPAESLDASPEYRLDKRVVAAVLFIVSGCFLVLGRSEIRAVLP